MIKSKYLLFSIHVLNSIWS